MYIKCLFVCLFVLLFFFATANLKFLEIDARGFEINGYTAINGYTTIMLHQQNPYILFLRLRETKNALQWLCICQLSSSCDSALRVPNIGEFGAKTYCVCVKRITLCNCLCSSSCGSASVIRNFGKFGAKNYFTGHQAANTIHGFRDSVTVLKIYGCY